MPRINAIIHHLFHRTNSIRSGNREVAKWLEQQDDGEPSPKISRHDQPTATVGLAGTVLSSNIYGTVVFDLTFFNEVTKSDNVLRGITANVIDSCIEVINGLPDIRTHRLIHRIPSYFDVQIHSNEEPQEVKTQEKLSMIANGSSLRLKSTVTCRRSLPCTTFTDLSTIGYNNTLCSMSGRPLTPQQRVYKKHPTISTEDLIKKKDLLDPLDDDDDIEWKANPFDVDSLDGPDETTEELMSKITFKGSPQLQTRLKALVLELIDVFATKVRREPAAVEPMKIVIDKDKWRLPCNRAPPRRHFEEKQKEIRKKVDALLKLGVIKESQASEWSQVHLVPKPTLYSRLCSAKFCHWST